MAGRFKRVLLWGSLSQLLVLLLLAGYYGALMVSDPIPLSCQFVLQDAEITRLVGGNPSCWLWYPSEIRDRGDHGLADVTLYVRGDFKALKAHLLLSKDRGAWRVVSGTYEGPSGMAVSIPTAQPEAGKQRADRGKVGKEGPSGPPEGPCDAEGAWERDPLAPGHRFFCQQDYPQALEAYSRILEQDGRHAGALYWRGRTSLMLGQKGPALEDLRRALVLRPRNGDTLAWLGWTESRSGDCDRAIRHLSRSIAQSGTRGWVFYERGLCYYRMGDQKRAAADIRRSCTLGYKNACRVRDRMQSGS